MGCVTSGNFLNLSETHLYKDCSHNTHLIEFLWKVSDRINGKHLAQFLVHINNGGEQNRPPSNMPLWHKNYCEELQTQEKLWKQSRRESYMRKGACTGKTATTTAHFFTWEAYLKGHICLPNISSSSLRSPSLLALSLAHGIEAAVVCGRLLNSISLWGSYIHT